MATETKDATKEAIKADVPQKTDAKVAVVIGVGPGLGAALARRFAQGGFRVAIVSRKKDNLEPVQKAIEEKGGSCLSVIADAGNTSSLKKCFQEIKKFGEISVLCYNAGAFVAGGILDITPETLEGVWKVSTLGCFVACQEVLPAMIAAKKGTILITGATASTRGSAKFAALAVPKFGLKALSQSLAREFHPQGVHVAHVIVDGQIYTPSLLKMQPNRQKDTCLDPDALAEVYWQLHVQDKTVWTQELDVRPYTEKW
jgi:short-subunit dehydrogenase